MGIFSSRDDSVPSGSGEGGSSPAAAHWSTPAVWVSDQASKSCQLCHMSFSIFWRRHHCRQCGSLVCYNCSLHKAMAVGFTTPQRVCTKCFVALANVKPASSSSGAAADQAESQASSRRGSVVDQSQTTTSTSFTVGATAIADSSSSSSSSLPPPKSTSHPPSPATTPRGSMVRKPSPAPAASPVTTGAGGRRRSSISGQPAFQQASAETTSPATAAAAAAEAPPSSSPSCPTYLPMESLLSESLFNRLGGFGSLLVLDLRSAEEYKAAHVPRSLNLPMTEGDLVEVSVGEVAGALTNLEQRLHMTDQRAFRMRQRCSVVLVGHPPEESEADAPTATSALSFSLTPILSLAHSHAALHLARLLTLEGKVANVCILAGGFAAFHATYPFVCCSYSPREMASGKHIHRKPFPWYPCEILIGEGAASSSSSSSSASVAPSPSSSTGMRIYLGSKVDASNREHLRHLQMTHVLNCTEEVPNTFEDEPPAEDGRPPLVYKRLALCDEVTVRITDVFAEAFQFFDQVHAHGSGGHGGGRVLVHCAEGISRSATVVIAYLMKTYQLTLHQAYSHTKSQRKQIFPNLGFWKQLDALEKELYLQAPADSPLRRQPYQSTMADCIDMALLTEEYKQRKAMAEGGAGGGDAASSSTDTMVVSASPSPPVGATPNGTWKLAGVASADARLRNEEAVVAEAQTPVGPIITAE